MTRIPLQGQAGRAYGSRVGVSGYLTNFQVPWRRDNQVIVLEVLATGLQKED